VLGRSSRGLTTVIIPLRLTANRAADSIVVIERCRIVEEGTHEQLVRAGGLYKKLWSEQFEKECDG